MNEMVFVFALRRLPHRALAWPSTPTMFTHQLIAFSLQLGVMWLQCVLLSNGSLWRVICSPGAIKKYFFKTFYRHFFQYLDVQICVCMCFIYSFLTCNLKTESQQQIQIPTNGFYSIQNRFLYLKSYSGFFKKVREKRRFFFLSGVPLSSFTPY